MREIDAGHAHALLMEIPRDMTGATAEIADRAESADAPSEAGQDLPVERLVVELVEDAPHVLVGDAVVGVLEVPLITH